MNIEKLLAADWRVLKEYRQELIVEIDRLEFRLRNLPDSEEMRHLFGKRSRMKERIPAIEDEMNRCKKTIGQMKAVIENRKAAMHDTKIQKNAGKLLIRHRSLLYAHKRRRASEDQIRRHEQFIWELEAPLQEVQQYLAQEILQQEQKCQTLETDKKDVLVCIAGISEYYRKLQDSIKKEIKEAVNKKDLCKVEEIDWATQDFEHLQWMLQNEPLYPEKLAYLYQLRHKEKLDDVDLPPIPKTAPVHTPKIRRKKLQTQETQTQKTPAPSLVQWRFNIASSENDPGEELPEEFDQCLKKLRLSLDKEDCQGMNERMVYNKLVEVTQMTRQQRQQMKRFKNPEKKDPGKPIRICKLGKKRRFFLFIDEENRRITFIPRMRSKAYADND